MKFFHIFLSLLFCFVLWDASLANPTKRNVVEVNVVDFVSAERTPIESDGLRFSVRYRKNVDDVYILVFERNFVPSEPETTEVGDGVWEMTYIVTNRTVRDHDIMVRFLSMDMSSYMTVDLENKEGQEFQTLTSLPSMTFTPSDLVYEPGEDVTLSAQIPVTFNGVSTNDIIQRLEPQFIGLNLNTQEYYNFFHQRDFYEFTGPDVNGDFLEGSVTLKTSTYPMTGVLEVNLKMEAPNRNIIEEVTITKWIDVRPSTQEGIFPPGFLTVVELPLGATSSNGNQLVRCEIGHQCYVGCLGVGYPVPRVEVSEVLPNGNLLAVEAQTIGQRNNTYATLKGWLETPGEDYGNAEGIKTFKCEAIDDSTGQTATGFIDVEAFSWPTIVEERTNLTVQTEQSNPHERTVTMTCVVTGQPTPSVNIYAYYSLHSMNSSTSIENSGPHEVTLTMVFHGVPVSAIHRLHRDIQRGYNYPPYCEGTTYPYHHVSHHFQVPQVC